MERNIIGEIKRKRNRLDKEMIKGIAIGILLFPLMYLTLITLLSVAN